MIQVTKAEAKRLGRPLDTEKLSAQATPTLQSPAGGGHHAGCSDGMEGPRQAAGTSRSPRARHGAGDKQPRCPPQPGERELGGKP